ncbi:penicillin-binding protein 1A [Chelatococcus sp. SYSU_G07232]|uniref:peptidoglycan glycosyltransferase n=1 Tax=Chelatococcus albus TaxID=3047466 RepID=A0ABT7AHI7_9HYPH|nr:penicillin-binding protein 1A [Chelatococcus sp. SYSU_G07232]MDJ1158818.1 penicillin-binding protein 1A [Chelatococcus sp. SYSU_G07232]
MSPRRSARNGGSGGRRSGGAGRRGGGRRQRSFLGHLVYIACVIGLWGIIGIAGVVAYHFAQLPPIDQLAVPKRPPNVAILSADGSLLANRGDTGGQAVSLKDLPPYLPKAFIAIEDRRFYSHFGIDPMGIARAVVRNVTSRGVAQGGSTLTQQLAKNLFLTQERTASRKIQEAILALWLEQKFSKAQILELYLNRVYFGAGSYGVEAAALRYFGKPAKDVTLSEAAVLAGLVQAPSRLAPNRNPDAAQARGQLVLTAMAEEGFISAAEAKTALSNPATAVRPRGAGSVNYAADYVMDVLDDFIGTVEKDIVVETTVDNRLQAAAERAIVEELDRNGAKFGVRQGALVSLAPDGAIKALVGGRNYGESQFNRATAAKRQPGSSFKPFVFLAALENGLTPDSVREDAPINYKGWQPENYSRRYSGPMTLTTALAHSINTVTARLILEMGPQAAVRTAQRLGVTSSLQATPALALGTSEVRPIELVAAYAAFANGGTGVIPYVIRQVKTTDGEVVYKRTPTDLGRVIDPPYVGMINGMLHEVMASGTGRKGNIPGWELAGKSGTTQEYRDAWFVGFSSRLVTGVWLGNDDNTPMKRVTGSNLPLEAWTQFMKVALQGQTPAPLPGEPWRRQAAPVDDGEGAAPLTQPLPPAAQGSAPAQAITQPADGGLRPPGAVAGQRAVPPPRRERGLLEQLFGG